MVIGALDNCGKMYLFLIKSHMDISNALIHEVFSNINLTCAVKIFMFLQYLIYFKSVFNT